MLYIKRILFSGILVSIWAQVASACPVCYGKNDAPMNAGLDAAILVMVGITGFVLLGIVAFVVWMRRRIQRRETIVSASSFVNEKGVLEVNNGKGVVEWNNF